MTNKRKDCPMRHKNGNCTVAGGFCTAVNDPICEALHNAFDCGYRSAIRRQEHFRDITKKVEPLTLDDLREAAQTGDPVWLVRANCSSWVVIEKVGDRKYLPCVDYAEFGSDEPYDFAISDYGDSFKAYRQKPEEGTV